MDHVLVLNASFEPLKIVHWQKAIQLLFQGKVEVLEESEREIRTISMKFRLPSVLRLLKFIPMAQRKAVVRFSRTNVFIRDNFTCSYCGRKRPRNELTLDHVIPVVQGGKKNWDNIATACIQCNQRKGGRTPHEAGMRLIARPRKPEYLPNITIRFGLKTAPEQWKVYFSWQLNELLPQKFI